MSRHNQVGKLATTINVMNGYTRVTYHSTCVVAFDDSEVWLDSGGWRTPTTKTRINQAAAQFDLGFRVWQTKGDWHVYPILPTGELDSAHPIPFTDGMRLGRTSTGSVFA